MSILANIARRYLDLKRLAELEKELAFARSVSQYVTTSSLGSDRIMKMSDEADEIRSRYYEQRM